VSLLTEADDIAMRWFYQPLLLLIANSTDSDLAKQVEYLKVENGILYAGYSVRLAERVRTI